MYIINISLWKSSRRAISSAISFAIPSSRFFWIGGPGRTSAVCWRLGPPPWRWCIRLWCLSWRTAALWAAPSAVWPPTASRAFSGIRKKTPPCGGMFCAACICSWATPPVRASVITPARDWTTRIMSSFSWTIIRSSALSPRRPPPPPPAILSVPGP